MSPPFEPIDNDQEASQWANTIVPIPGPPGPPGEQGPPPDIEIGEVTQAIEPGATITGSGTQEDPYQLNLQLPQGPAGSPGNPGGPASFTIGTVNTGTPNVTLGGTPPNYVLNFTLPVGTPGPSGPPGAITRILSGSTPPDNSVGNPGEWYIDTVAGNLWGPKGETAWPTNPTLSLIGPPGPVEEAPEDGQMYVRQNGAWVLLPSP